MRSLLCAVAALLVCAPAAGATTFTPGAAGAGDPFFPLAGNGGYDVRNYSLRLDFEPRNGALNARAVITARATQNLSRFDLDLRGLRVGGVTVDGAQASFRRDGQELIITPAAGIRNGRTFVVAVDYDGHPKPVIDPDKSRDGWIPTDDGAFVVNEPQGSPSWYPVNDTPKDKATYDYAITVPKGRTAVANGLLVSVTDNGATTTWRWRASDPTAPYLATATSGIFEMRVGSINGIPEYNFVDPQTRSYPNKIPTPELAWERLAFNEPAVSLFTELYGPYPFESVGGVMDWAPNVFYSLESQTRPMYWNVVDELTVVHEIAHMWFGDSVSLEVWPDIWLNEGFATWSEWIWSERHGGPTAAEIFDDLYAIPEDSGAGHDLWFPAPAALPGPEAMFHTPVYYRGAMTLQALRDMVGDAVFFTILRTWYAENRNGNVTTGDFIALSERVSGRQLDDFFRVWLYEEGRP
ncbi:MAG TPA: M1 family metallopeptidase [Solirubrobacter sp.]|nr:M1 family metallopeptidase [Solirubrobacter sp.]